MLGLSQKVLLEKARARLRAGQLDEAYALITDSKVREHAQGQALLDRITPALVERAEAHVAAGRLEEALADVERATVTGGKRAETLALRDRILGELDDGRKAKNKKRALVQSVQGHLRAGRLVAAADRLDDLPAGTTTHVDLQREMKRRQEERGILSGRARDHLKHGELPSALQAASELLQRSRGAGDGPASESETSADEEELLRTVARESTAAVAQSLDAANLERARDLAAKLEPLVEAGHAESSWKDALDLVDEAARTVQKSDWPRARVLVGRLRGILPNAKWVDECGEHLRTIEDAVREVRSGPLAPAAPTAGLLGDTLPVAAVLETNPAPRPANVPRPVPACGGVQQWVLWVDGVGSYLLLPQERVTVGRAGSSSRPTIPLSADLHGIHAEFLRTDGDYFAVARGKVWVDGQEVQKHLLADRDELVLGARTRITFRLPTKLSATALLTLGSRQRLPGDVRSIVLLDEHLILGNDGECHVAVPNQSERIVVSRDGDGFRVSGPEPLVVDGRIAGDERTIPVGARVEIGSLAFTITAESVSTPDGFGEGGTA